MFPDQFPGRNKMTRNYLLYQRNIIYRWCIIELYTWNLYNLINQCHPNKFNKNIFFVYVLNYWYGRTENHYYLTHSLCIFTCHSSMMCLLARCIQVYCICQSHCFYALYWLSTEHIMFLNRSARTLLLVHLLVHQMFKTGS